MKIVKLPWDHAGSPGGFEKLIYTSDQDGLQDWALARPPESGRVWVVHLHGHGSGGDQICTRADIKEHWLARYLELGLGVLSPNLRGNSWMCPEAVEDLRALLEAVRRDYGARWFCLVSGSMGGTGNLIYATVHPEDVAVVVALCPATDIASYHEWCRLNPGSIRDEIRNAIECFYGGTPGSVADRYLKHSALRHADRLTMPLFLSHAVGDEIIPVEQSRALVRRLGGCSDTTYVEIPEGNHDSPLHGSGMLDWLAETIGRAGLMS